MTKVDATPDDLIAFLRRKDYQLVRELGQGACGKTVLLYDEELEQHFVCKKYQPYDEAERSTLYLGFKREVKLLHQVLHVNVVRIFNSYLFSDLQAGYILMEYVDGKHVDEFVKDHPEKLADVFQQAIEGFAYLESLGILHRDIRPANLLVRDDGVVKIIDLGFAKKIVRSSDFGKSITLNWGYDPPQDFATGRYDFATEVYFVGKLFEGIIAENHLEQFPDAALLWRMCQPNPAERIGSFREVLAAVQKKQFSEIEFSVQETLTYRTFAAELRSYFVNIDSSASYVDDGDLLLRQLEDAFRSVMLEEKAPENSRILGASFVGGIRTSSAVFQSAFCATSYNCCEHAGRKSAVFCLPISQPASTLYLVSRRKTTTFRSKSPSLSLVAGQPGRQGAPSAGQCASTRRFGR